MHIMVLLIWGAGDATQENRFSQAGKRDNWNVPEQMSSLEDPVGIFTHCSIKVQAVQIVIVADLQHRCKVWRVWGRFSTFFLDWICFSTRTYGHDFILWAYPCLVVLSTVVFPLLLNKAALHLWHVGAESYWGVTGKLLISPITVIPFDLEHHKGNILLIFSVRGFNRPPAKYDGSSGMWFYFIFFKMHTWPRERELQYLQSVIMETFTICTWCSKACELVDIARQCSSLTVYIGKNYG